MTAPNDVLTREEEKRLANRIAEGMKQGRPLRGDGLAARNELVTRNTGLVHATLNRYMPREVQKADLEQEGKLGLIRAAERYDASNDVRFGTYAVYWIKDAIHQGIGNHSSVIHLPYYIRNMVRRWKRKAVEMGQGGDRPTPEEIGEQLKLSPKVMERVMRALSCLEKADESLLYKVCQDESEPECEKTPISYLLEKSPLLPSELDVIALRYGIGEGGQPPMTLKEVGGVVGCSDEWVRQVEKKAFAKLRKHFRNNESIC